MAKKELELYELVLLLKFTTVEESTRKKVDFYKDFIKDKGAQVMVKNHGKKSLAYPVQGYQTATWVQIVYLGNNALTRQINVQVSRDDFILRSLTTKLVDRTVAEMFDVNKK